MRAFLTLACCAGFFVLGLVIALIGVGLNAFAERFAVSPTAVGSAFFLCIGLSTFVMLFVVGPLIDRYGQKPVLVVGSLACGLSMLGLGLTGSFALGCALMVLAGVGSAGINGGVNTLINELYREAPGRAMNLVHLFFGVGAVCMPLLAGWLLAGPGLERMLTIAAALCLVPALMAALTSFPAAGRVAVFRLEDARRAAADPLVVIFALVLLLHVGVESSVCNWSRLALVDRWQLGPPLDQLILGGYWASFMCGRLLAGTMFSGIPGERLVPRCLIGASLALGGFLLAPGPELAAAAIWFAGLCFGPVFPSTLGLAGQSFHKYVGTIFSLITASGVLGAVMVSTGVGQIGGRLNLGVAFGLILMVCLLALAACLLLSLRLKKRWQAPALRQLPSLTEE